MWTFAPRRIHRLTETLVEVPTSTVLVPAGSPTFSIFRGAGSRALLHVLAVEARLLPDRVLCVQFHPKSFNPATPYRSVPQGPLTVGEFLPKRRGGFTFKHRLRETDPAAAAAVTTSLVDRLAGLRCLTISEIARETAGRTTRPGYPVDHDRGAAAK